MGMEFKDKMMLHCFRKVKGKQGFTTGIWYITCLATNSFVSVRKDTAFLPAHFLFLSLDMSKHVSFLCFFNLPFIHPSVLPKAQQNDPPTHFQSSGRRTVYWLQYLPRHQLFCFSLNRHCIFASSLFTFLSLNIYEHVSFPCFNHLPFFHPTVLHQAQQSASPVNI